MSGECAVSVHDVSHRFHTQTLVLDRVRLEVRSAETVVLLGPSGCGKSTLLRCINGLIEPDSGSIQVFGSDIATVPRVELRRSIGYASQAVALFPFWTVARNVALPLRLQNAQAGAQREEAARLLGAVELDAELGERYPEELSGGQAQRVGVARALAGHPRLLLMDEPFGAVDAITRAALQKMLRRLVVDRGIAMLFVTHDLFEALAIADRVAIMRAGRIEQQGTAREILSQPSSEYVERLFDEPRRQIDLFLEGGR